ncbi:MAG TPA: copper resistance protein CopC [Phototrophicaceae bacterium]|nr:copper resistance protein CopC [Phototrophicaceae bacterium]
MRRVIWLSLLLLLIVAAAPVLAHANLLRSDPPASATLASAPAVISLWMSEPVEPNFSSIQLLDSKGSPIKTPASTVDPADQKHMLLAPGSLPDGVYTVSWRAISAADGHPTNGSFAFAVGSVTGLAALAAPDTETIPAFSAPVRWFDILALTLAVGSVAFAVGVTCEPPQEERMRRLMWIGWGLLAVSSVVLLLYQTTQETNAALIAALPALGEVLTGTRFGTLLIERMIVWVVLGIALLRRRYGIALAAGGMILLLHAVYSHASVTDDALPSVAADWLHLAATALWVGGLFQLSNVLLSLRHENQPLVPLVAKFSNYARICVIVLIVTGLYSAWLEVGSVAALIASLYGRALIVKSILFAPLLLIAAINLFVTPRGLQSGNPVWAKRLRMLVGAEIALTLGIFAAVAVMTSADPARASLASRLPPPDHTITDYQVVDDLHIHLDVAPGWVGQNQFVVTLLDLNGNPVDDASLIRVRFTNLSQNIGQSEVRPKHTSNGQYIISGANLSLPGTWRARVTVQRPNKFDSLADFSLDMQSAPTPPGLDMSQPLDGRQWALLIGGLALLAAGGILGGRGRFTPFRGTGILITATLLVGLILLIGAVL